MRGGTSAKSSSERSVLIVDDESYVLSALKRSLLNQGFMLITASSVPEALTILKNQRFQVVISDYNMPFMLGPEFLEKVKAMQPEAVRVVLTGVSDLKTIQSFIRTGQAMRYLLKPWDIEEIQSTLRECFEIFLEQEKKMGGAT